MADAKQKRNEQLKRWLGSETDLEPPILKKKKTKVKFDDGAVFLAACSSGDTEEVLRMLDRGADINYANVDGLTALHQVCSPPASKRSCRSLAASSGTNVGLLTSNCLPWNTCQMEAILIPLFTYRAHPSFSTQSGVRRWALWRLAERGCDIPKAPVLLIVPAAVKAQ